MYLLLGLGSAQAAQFPIFVGDAVSNGPVGDVGNDLVEVGATGLTNVTAVHVQGTITPTDPSWSGESGLQFSVGGVNTTQVGGWGSNNSDPVDVDFMADFSGSPLEVPDLIELFESFDDPGVQPDGNWSGLTITLIGDTDTAFVEGVISSTPGFESVIGSAERFSSTSIGDNLVDDYADLAGCTDHEQIAGTWVRNRGPRVQGETEFGEIIAGSSLTSGTIGTDAFTADLNTRGFTGIVDDGTEIVGTWTRVNNKKVIFYGVRASCGVAVL